MSPDVGGQADRIRVVRIIARLNIGGPAIQAITLTKRLEELSYDTTLVRGREEPDEGNMDYLAEELDVVPILVPSLRRNPGRHDIAALWALVRLIRRTRPHIVHTHAAKAGTLGRLATLIAFPLRSRRPVMIHTYHGHSLTGYFSRRTAAIYRAVERVLALFTDRLIAVSPQVRDELVAMNIATREQFDVVRLGFDLSPFVLPDSDRAEARKTVRDEFGISVDAPVVTLVARLVPIKRVDRFLRVAAALRELPRVRFLIVGDGELRDELQQSEPARVIAGQATWAGFRRDVAAILYASDIVVLTSDNEGTPVSLIEAQAAGVPVLSTRVGGVESVVLDGQTGFIFDRSDEQSMAAGLRRLVEDAHCRRAFGEAARDRGSMFAIGHLVRRLDALYRQSLTPGSDASEATR